MDDQQWARTIKDTLQAEIAKGGTMDETCPFCGLPLCERSSYIRCQRCGKNWLPGEDLSKDPRLSRDQKPAKRPLDPAAVSVDD